MNETQEFQKIRLQVGESNFRAGIDFTEVEFQGKLLSSRTLLTGDPPYEDNYGEEFAVYQTAHNKIAVYHREFSRLYYGGYDKATLKVYDNIYDVDRVLPSLVLNETLSKLGIDTTEYLDI